MTKINCDMGESFGIYSAGNDEEIMPLIDVANVACGFHASDPNHMRKTVELAKKHKVKVGAHPSFPDLQGFGRREMKMPKLDLKNMIMYQVGALKAFLDELDMPLNHIKPHGSLYVMASKDEEMARAIADAVETFNVSIFGMANTAHEKIYKEEIYQADPTINKANHVAYEYTHSHNINIPQSVEKIVNDFNQKINSAAETLLGVKFDYKSYIAAIAEIESG